MAHGGPVTIRPARPGDRDWILSLAPRLHEFGPPPWRPREVMDRAVTISIDEGLTSPKPDQTVLVAESAALMAAAEEWAHAHRFRLVSLHVFDGNARARALYERLGYRLDIVKMIKTLR